MKNYFDLNLIKLFCSIRKKIYRFFATHWSNMKAHEQLSHQYLLKFTKHFIVKQRSNKAIYLLTFGTLLSPTLWYTKSYHKFTVTYKVTQ